MKGRLSPIWRSAVLQFERGRQWLMLRQQAAFLSAGGAVVLLLFIFSGVTAAVAAVAAWIALIRHFAQTDADRQRRITESYSKATEQLASDKMEMRLGGIYTLERISRESPDDYWTVMETLTAFVRERARWKEPDLDASKTVVRFYQQDQQSDRPHHPPTDIAAVLTVIVRRPETERSREKKQGWRLDLRRTDLRGAYLNGAHLEGANFFEAHLERAILLGAHLEGANFFEAHLERTYLNGAHLEGANFFAAHLRHALLSEAHLERADLNRAHLEVAGLSKAHLEGADLNGAHLEGAYLGEAHLEGANFFAADLVDVNLSTAIGDAKTRLPDWFPRPANWPPYCGQAGRGATQ
jgi:uncharacterized protein YjbI with pentapeptide repeats